MSVIITGVYFNTMKLADARAQGFDHIEAIAFKDTRVVGVNAIGVKQSIEDWIEEQCADKAMLCRTDSAFFIAFRDLTDATLFRTRFA